MSEMAQTIRAERARREAARQEANNRSSLQAELEAARAELAKLKGGGGFEDDPVAYAKAKGWSPEQQLMFGKALLFDLAPDKADPDFRQKMFEDRYNRKEREKEQKAAEEAQRAQYEAVQMQMQNFYSETVQAVAQFEAGSYPESEAFFGSDAGAYINSLMLTAQNMAAEAERTGQVADLSARSIASVLEAETARRMMGLDQRRKRTQAPAPAAAPTQTPAQPASGMQPVETASTRHMSGQGTPLPPAQTDDERIQRAIAAGWGPR